MATYYLLYFRCGDDCEHVALSTDLAFIQEYAEKRVRADHQAGRYADRYRDAQYRWDADDDGQSFWQRQFLPVSLPPYRQWMPTGYYLDTVPVVAPEAS